MVFPSISVSEALYRRFAVPIRMQTGISRLSNLRHRYPDGETFGAVAKTNQVMMPPSEPTGTLQ
jgi:hypothetical protein